MSKRQTNNRNATGTGAATSTGYVAPEKSKVIPIRPYKYDDDDDDDIDIDDIPLLSLAAAGPSPTIRTTSSSDHRNRNHKSNSDDDNDDNNRHPVAPEYTMIELNGILLPPIEFPPIDTCQSIFGTDRRVELGKFYMSGPDQKIPTMILGSHQVKGKVKKLKSSFCLMEKRYTTSTTADNNNKSSSKPPPPKKKQKKQIECYQIIGIVKEKIIFDTYPKVIMRKMI